MLSDAEQQKVDTLVNSDHMVQCEDAWLEAPLAGVELAIMILNQTPPLSTEIQQKALDFLLSYGNIEQLPLNPASKRALMAMNYGEDEVQAMEYLAALQAKFLASPTRELWYFDGTFWHVLEGYQVLKHYRFYYEQGTDLAQMRALIDPDHSRDASILMHTSLDELIQHVQAQFKVEIYDIPLEAWVVSPVEQTNG